MQQYVVQIPWVLNQLQDFWTGQPMNVYKGIMAHDSWGTITCFEEGREGRWGKFWVQNIQIIQMMGRHQWAGGDSAASVLQWNENIWVTFCRYVVAGVDGKTACLFRADNTNGFCEQSFRLQLPTRQGQWRLNLSPRTFHQILQVLQFHQAWFGFFVLASTVL